MVPEHCLCPEGHGSVRPVAVPLWVPWHRAELALSLGWELTVDDYTQHRNPLCLQWGEKVRRQTAVGWGRGVTQGQSEHSRGGVVGRGAAVALYMAWASLRNLNVVLWVTEGYSRSELLRDTGNTTEVTCVTDERSEGLCWCGPSSSRNGLGRKWWLEQWRQWEQRAKLFQRKNP